MTLPKRLLSLTLVWCLVVSTAPMVRASTSNYFGPADKGSPPAENPENEPKGLKFRLSEAPDQPQTQPASKLAPAIELSKAETEAILKLLPFIKTAADDQQPFVVRERSLPPPRTGKTIDISFPGPATAAAPSANVSGPLEVIRFAPEGDSSLAPHLTVTFSQPMISLSSQEEAATNVPVKWSPQPAGKWRWVGTQTLLFEPDGRFPMATEYSVTIPAGTRSATGGTLSANKSWSFTTPPPTLKNSYPQGDTAQRRDALIFIEFDQRINRAVVMSTIKLRAGNTELRARLATDEEIKADKEISERVKAAGKDRWLVLRAIDGNGATRLALPGDTTITVSVEPQTPSAEGPLVTAKQQQFTFRTFGSMRLLQGQNGHSSTPGPPPPSLPWYLQFSNHLDAQALTRTQIRIEPALDFQTQSQGNVLIINGQKKANTTYKVTLDKSIQDIFGQTLGQDQVVTIKVGSEAPSLELSGDDFIVLDPGAPPRLSLYSLNYQTAKVSLYAVAPEDWAQFMIVKKRSNEVRRKFLPVEGKLLPGRLALSKQLDLKSPPDEFVENGIDLSPALTAGLGQVVVMIEPILPAPTVDQESILSWVQVTKIGLDAFVDHNGLLGWATSLADGAPLAGVRLRILPEGGNGITGTDGLARLSLSPNQKQRTGVLVAQQGNDVAILPEGTSWWSDEGSWHKTTPVDSLRWYVFDDRKIYRPGEEVHVKGWLRRIGGAVTGDVGPLNGAAQSVSYVIEDSKENEIARGRLTLNVFGGFDTSFKLPQTMNLGEANLTLEAIGGDKKLEEREFTHSFQIQEFRRPEFEVETKNQTEGPLFVGHHADISVAANYFAGGPLADAAVKWQVKSEPTNFTPPNRSDFTFGKWIPWWTGAEDDDEQNDGELEGRTDATGRHRLRIDFDSVNPARASTVTSEASVMDVNRQQWTSTTTLLVHPANQYVGLKSEKTFVQQGEPLMVQSIVTDLDGKAIVDREVKLRAVLLDWQQVKGEWDQVEIEPQDCVVRSAADAVKCSFRSNKGGTYRVTATIRDDRGRANESELTLWVAGGKQPPDSEVEADDVTLIPDRKEYQAGDTAEVLVQAPFFPAEAVMTLRRSGIVRTERFRMDGFTHTLRVRIEEAWTPNVHLQVDLVGAAEVQGPEPEAQSQKTPESSQTPDAQPARKSPAFASGEINLSIPPSNRRLVVTSTPQEKTLEPGSGAVVNVEVKNASGQAVPSSEVAVVVVDEAVLALTDYTVSDPLSHFYQERDADVSDHHLRESVQLSGPIEGGGGPGGGGGGTLMGAPSRLATRAASIEVQRLEGADGFIGQFWRGQRTTKTAYSAEYGKRSRGVINVITKSGTTDPAQDVQAIRMRENFNALAIFAPSVRTDANGRAQVKLKLPDNLTRYRVMAIAVAGGKFFGNGESTITARLPLMARPSAPRFLNFGDRFELPIVVQNQTDAPMTVNVAVRATNATLQSSTSALQDRAGTADVGPSIAGRRVTVPPNDRVEVRIPAAAVQAGTARFQIAALSGRWSDAAEVSLPVWTPATTEAFATYGELDEGVIIQPVKAPAGVFKQFGGLEIETSSTQLQELTDAFLYLQNYPFECSEQLASRIISVAALRDVLTAFKAKDLPPAKDIEAAVVRDIKRLQSLQDEGGGFGFWRRGEVAWPYLSIHVAHALARAREKKFDVPEEMFGRSKNYLRKIETHIPLAYGPEVKRALIAYALYVRHRMGDPDPARARKLITEAGTLDNLSLESIGWLLSVLSADPGSQSEVAAIRGHLNNRATETAATAHFASSYKDGDYLLLNSNRRGDGIILEALIGDQPNSDLIPKVVRGLLANRTRGRWENTQENVFILLALDRYFKTYEKATPNFVASVWLGNDYAGAQQFRGRTTDRRQVNVPMSYLAEKPSAQNLTLSKEGAGRLYYRLGMKYAPLDLQLQPADYGFTVQRTYEAIDHPDDVRRDAEGVWHVKAGARVRVRLTMVAPARRYHVALVDPLPAGFESLNPALTVTESIPEDKVQEGVSEYGSHSFGPGWWRWRPHWFDHQNLRDERTEAFASLLWEGVYNYSYVARATTPGHFVVPPSRAEEMYHPETFGRGKTDRVRVE